MSKKSITIIGIVAVVAIAFIWGIGVNNKLVTEEENVSKAWSQVENVYKRRMDLIPQLVNTVQGAANYEKSVLTEVTNARAGVQEATVDPSTLSEEQIKAYQQAQDKLSKAVANTIMMALESEELKLSDGEGPQALSLESPGGHHKTVALCPEGSGQPQSGVE